MRKTATDHKQALINSLMEERKNLLAAIGALPPDRRDEPCIGTWSVKQLVAHLIGWDITNLQAVKEILAGQRPTFFQYYDPDWHSYNARLVETHRREPYEVLLADAAATHQELVAFLQALPAEELLQGKSPAEQGRPVTIRNLLMAETGDEHKHCEQVQAFRAKVLPESHV